MKNLKTLKSDILIFEKGLLTVLIIILTSCKPEKVYQSEGAILSTQDKEKNEISSKSTEDTFESLLDRSRIEHKNIFLVFSFQSCGWCRIFEKYHTDSLVNNILNRYLIIKMIDVIKNPEGSDLYQKYGKIGFPSWAILDSAKNVIADSGNRQNGEGNIGFPRAEMDIQYYLKALKKSTKSIRNSECEILGMKLKEYNPEAKK
jgi:thioredoxin-related protein